MQLVLGKQERLIVNTLQFNMSVPTHYVFMRRFLKAAESDKKVTISVGVDGIETACNITFK